VTIFIVLGGNNFPSILLELPLSWVTCGGVSGTHKLKTLEDKRRDENV